MGKGIDIMTGFSVKSATPIDDRSTKKTLAEMYAIKTVYEGLQCFCQETKVSYIYTNGAWDDKAFGTTGLATDTKTTDEYLIR